MAGKLKAMQTQLENNSLTVSASERETREREFKEATLTFERLQRTLNEDMSRRRDEELAGFSDRVNRAVKQVAESEKLDIIFREIAWGNRRLDITEKVIRAIEESRSNEPSTR